MTIVTTDPPVHVLPQLTRNGYERTAETEAHIQAALSISRDTLVKRARVRDKDHALFVGEEALVFLIRYYKLRGDSFIEGQLCDVLVKRTDGTIKKWMREVGFRYEDDEERVTEMVQEVLFRVFGGSKVRGEDRREGGILDLESDKSDFAQSRFWKFLRYRTADVTRVAGDKRDRERQSVDVSTMNGEPADDDAPAEMATPLGGWESVTPWEALTQEHDDDLLRAAVRDLPNHPTPYRDVLRLHYFDEWQIEANDAEAVTLSSHFGKSPRTISSWLRKAEKKLRDILKQS
ncbi:hypothetical protein B1759_15770 [Rubrivirga sp. SAORIC476]|jgi:DNA-directed RNA polymerase specialized sigma24 family protein|uniref:sigma-70 family RNA polymerase sigma factor n=1 Tax=Rubrivirga sp. SAORIC476 TaxID=1961794 RepID=UPI000BA95077|nr:sigma-70 family RNA polymerase sigma factor [Rubrivirga sp. SAORIC476]PAP78897.1 hypothetical protein B1759_15770 [Rubrivirga sp. SAORIC476]